MTVEGSSPIESMIFRMSRPALWGAREPFRHQS